MNALYLSKRCLGAWYGMIIAHLHMSYGGLVLVSEHDPVPLQLDRFFLAPNGGHFRVQLRLCRFGFLKLPPKKPSLINKKQNIYIK